MAFLRPGAGKLYIIKIAKNGCFGGSPKSRPGRLLGGHFGDFFNIDFSIFWGAPKTSIFDISGYFYYSFVDFLLKFENFGIPGGTAIRGQNRPFFGPPFWPAKTAPGGDPERPKLEFWRCGPHLAPKPVPGTCFPQGLLGESLGVPGRLLESLRKALYIYKNTKLPVNRFSGA